MRQYLDEIPIETRQSIYGIIFAASCDFSKLARDTLNEWARSHGISETHLWGKGELEDQLYQPKNDNLLFAYFNISLQIRKRSIKTALRSRLAMKKRAETVFSKKYHRLILLRDPTDERYPATDNATENHRGKWRVVAFGRLGVTGLLYQERRHFAFVDDEYKGWDIAEAFNLAVPSKLDDWWGGGKDQPDHSNAWHFWHEIPLRNRANYYVERLIKYEDILAIDEVGDRLAKFPHVYIDTTIRPRQFTRMEMVEGGHEIYPDSADRIKHFPEIFPDPRPIPIPDS